MSGQVTIQCPNCRAGIRVQASDGDIPLQCPYCGFRYIARMRSQPQPGQGAGWQQAPGQPLAPTREPVGGAVDQARTGQTTKAPQQYNWGQQPSGQPAYPSQQHPAQPGYQGQPTSYPQYPPRPMAPYPQYPGMYYPPPYDPKTTFSWESYPQTYPPVRRKHHAKGLAKPAGAILLLVGLILLFTSLSVLYVPEMLDFDAPVTLTGMVADSGGYPLEDVNITVTANGYTANTTSDWLGGFEVEDVPAGEVQITASKDGYRTMNMTLFLVEEISESANIIMSKGDGYGEGFSNYESKADILGSMYASVVLGSLFAVFAILGGYWALQKRHLSVALVGGILSIGQPVVLLGTVWAVEAVSLFLVVPGALALVLVIAARHEFRHRFDD